MEIIFTLLAFNGAQSPGKLPSSSLLTENKAEDIDPVFANGSSGAAVSFCPSATLSEPSSISTLARRSQPRARPEIRTCTHSGLLSRTSNSSSELARNSTLAFELGSWSTGVWSCLTAIRFVGCDWFSTSCSRPRASCSSPASLLSLSRELEGTLIADDPGNCGIGAEISYAVFCLKKKGSACAVEEIAA